MTKELVETYELHGGSKAGSHFWMNLAQCPIKTVHDKQSRGAGPQILTAGRGIGTIYHAFMDLYHSEKEFDPFELRFVDKDGLPIEADPVARADASKLYHCYRDKFTPDAFGDVVATEWPFPTTAEDEVKVAKAVGLPVFTGVLDMLVDMKPEHCDRLNYNFGTNFEPGIYGLDHKTEKARMASIVDEYKDSLQFTGYSLAYEAVTGTPLKGFIASICFKLKSPEWWVIQVDGLDTAIEQKAAWQGFAQYASMLYANDSFPANPAACYGKFRKPCDHLVSGRCMRYGALPRP